MSAGCTPGPDVHDWEVFPLMWERDPRIDDGHAHEWQLIHRFRPDGRTDCGEFYVRCAVCLCPRCGYSQDEDPCMERRHHRGLHIHLSGAFRFLGDLEPTPDDPRDIL